jgi:hypothetical protein
MIVLCMWSVGQLSVIYETQSHFYNTCIKSVASGYKSKNSAQGLAVLVLVREFECESNRSILVCQTSKLSTNS